jgi:hypothetical protein
MTNHEATPEQWAALEAVASHGGTYASDCLLELRARVQTLEQRCEVQLMQLSDLQERHHRLTLQVGHLEHELVRDDDDEPQQYCLEAMDPPETNAKPTPNPLPIRSSLVERVSCAIDRNICPDQWLHQDAARAAIREVADAARMLDEAAPETVLTWGGVVQWLEHEIAQPTCQEDYDR